MSILYVHIAFKRRNLIPWEPEQAEIPQSDIFCGNFKIPICLYSGTHRASSWVGNSREISHFCPPVSREKIRGIPGICAPRKRPILTHFAFKSEYYWLPKNSCFPLLLLLHTNILKTDLSNSCEAYLLKVQTEERQKRHAHITRTGNISGILDIPPSVFIYRPWYRVVQSGIFTFRKNYKFC